MPSARIRIAPARAPAVLGPESAELQRRQLLGRSLNSQGNIQPTVYVSDGQVLQAPARRRNLNALPPRTFACSSTYAVTRRLGPSIGEPAVARRRALSSSRGEPRRACRDTGCSRPEPDAFSIDDLARVGREEWSGVRSFQARNLMREMKPGRPRLLLPLERRSRRGSPASARWSPRRIPTRRSSTASREYYDRTSKRERPEVVVRRRAASCASFARLIPLAELRAIPGSRTCRCCGAASASRSSR